MPLLRTILPWQVQEDDLEERRRQERENIFARLDSIHAEWQAEQAVPRMVPEPQIDLRDLFDVAPRERTILEQYASGAGNRPATKAQRLIYRP